MSHSIYVIDDETLFQDLIVDVLKGAGYLATSFESIPTALSQTLQSPPDLLMTDLMLGGELDGLSLIQKVRQKHENIKCILVTGYAKPEIAAKIKALKDCYFLEKPFSPDRVLDLVKVALQ